MRNKLTMGALLLALLLPIPAAAVDSKSLLLGFSMGMGVYVSRNYVAKPVARAVKRGTKKTVRATVHICTLGKK